MCKKYSRLILSGCLMICVLGCWLQSARAQAPTSLEDFFLPGSQPGDSGNIEQPSKCDNCHGDYDLAVEPAFNWRGSMMAQAARDPLFYACMAIANQDAPDSGDLCIRCHSPSGWLEGRSVPTDGSALNSNDREGVQCDFCHKLVMPSPLGSNPFPDDPFYSLDTYPEDQSYLASLTSAPDTSANGMYIADNANAKRGPFVDAEARHKMLYSPFHREAAICGTCHDVSNPVFSADGAGNYLPNEFGQPAPNFSPYAMFPVERTFSEWLLSDFNSPTGAESATFGLVSTCQDCHMPDVTGVGCSIKGVPVRTDLPLHDLTGGNTTMPDLVAALYPDEVDRDALNSGKARARSMLQKAATMELRVSPFEHGFEANVRVVNETAHKLPSGYPEGRRIWINLRAHDEGGEVVFESGRYDFENALIETDPATDPVLDEHPKIYEIKPGISAELAPAVGLPAGPSFHFVLNNKIFADNRIPPRGFTNDGFDIIQSPPVDYTYADGQYWDDTIYALPPTTEHVVATLYYQTTTREYVEFLRDENRTNDWGQFFYDLWAANGKSAPEKMAEVVWYRPQLSAAVNGGGDQRSMVTSLKVTFRKLVDVDAGAFEVTQRGTGDRVDVTFDTEDDDQGQTVATLTFAGNMTEHGSLVDGSYELLVKGDHVHERESGRELDGDSDGESGGDFLFGSKAEDGFFRLFGDADGDRDVDNRDFLKFRAAFRTTDPDPAYQWYFDFDADGDVDNRDFLKFSTRFRTELPFE